MVMRDKALAAIKAYEDYEKRVKTKSTWDDIRAYRRKVRDERIDIVRFKVSQAQPKIDAILKEYGLTLSAEIENYDWAYPTFEWNGASESVW
jgi:hypothetical protein